MAEGEAAIAEIIPIPKTFLEKLLFYTTAFFILLGTFSLFAFLFLVPFVIDPAFTTIFMQFAPVPALCVTVDTSSFRGASNCSWASCREGCTREVYDCTQIRVNYKIVDWASQAGKADDTNDVRRRKRRRRHPDADVDEAVVWAGGAVMSAVAAEGPGGPGGPGRARRWASRRDEDWWSTRQRWQDRDHQPLAPRNDEPPVDDYPVIASIDDDLDMDAARGLHDLDAALDASMDVLDGATPTGLQGNDSEWYFVGARLFPNVKGCGYPPMLNCSVFLKKYREIGTNFTCFYSKIDPGLVIDDLDMWQVYMNLVYAMAIPIPSFIISIIYLTVAYFKIYATEDDANATGVENTPLPGSPLPGGTSGGITPISEVFRDDMASFGHQLKVAMVDEMSRDSVMDACIVTSNSMGNCVGSIGTPHGNLSRTMTTSITTPPGPIAEL
ncbi:protein tipE [Thrips palmi]|uniref:Protein tipE n=1 Tax=Thrips palmi TaxID=161013 RepID=A0A6P9A784_THRPL|nr:protein tipE [Thrips palmi]